MLFRPPRYRPTTLELSVVVIQVVIMLLFAWSFTVGTPSEAFVALMASLGVHTAAEFILVLSVMGALASPRVLWLAERSRQQRWYGLCASPLAFYGLAIGYYRSQVGPGDVTIIIIYLAFAVILGALGVAAFRDPGMRLPWTQTG